MDSSRDPLRVLVLAESANPEWTSVPLIGWSLSHALAKVVSVHLVTHARNKEALLRQGLLEGRDFTSIDNDHVASPVYLFSEKLRGGVGKGWTVSTGFASLVYYSFELEFWRRFSKRIKAGEYDIVHRITPVSPTSPSIVAKRLSRLGIPFIVGPLNGGLPWPKNFRKVQHQEREWLSYVRGLYKALPGYGSMRKYSSAILVGSRHTFDEMSERYKYKCVFIPENGIDTERFWKRRDRRTFCAPLKVAFVGRLVPYKGADVLIEAAADALRQGQLELHIVGDGPQRGDLEAMVARFQVEGFVKFHGWLPHTQVQDIIGDCDLVAMPSIREFGGGVVLESMALGVAPMIADYGGPSELVDDDTGIRVPFSDRNSLVDGFRVAIESVIRSPERLLALGEAARRKVSEEFTWDVKARQIVEIYKAVLQGKRDLNYLGYQNTRGQRQ